jgi:hypothetical protein
MDTKKLYLAILAAAAMAPAVHAMPAHPPQSPAGPVVASADAPRMSDAALGQILASPNVHLARAFVQENGPSWAQWMGQVKRL